MTEEAVQLAYDAMGPEAAQPVFLLHGFPLSRAIWTNAMVPMSQDLRVIAPDLPGHGASPVPQGKGDLDAMARSVLALADQLGVERFDLVAHSMGGYVAYQLLRMAPDRVRRLVLVCTRATADTEPAKEGRRKQADMVQMDGVRALADLLVPKLVNPASRGYVVEEARRTVEGMPVSGAVYALEAMRERPDSVDLLPKLDKETLVIAGGEDQVMPRSEQSLLVDGIPGARLELMNGSGHLPMMEQPKEFAELVAGFLKG